jgi:hypothetical protein
MLENCLSGSEGGGAFALPTPIFRPSRGSRRVRRWCLHDLESSLSLRRAKADSYPRRRSAEIVVGKEGSLKPGDDLPLWKLPPADRE